VALYYYKERRRNYNILLEDKRCAEDDLLYYASGKFPLISRASISANLSQARRAILELPYCYAIMGITNK